MKIAIIGAGGTRTPLIVRALEELNKRMELSGKETISSLSLFDIDSRRLELVSRIWNGKCRIPQDKARNLEEAVEGAGYIIFSIRPGWEEMRILDEKIPREFGLIGQETVGAGGGAMAVRTFPEVLKLVKVLREWAPEAWVINFTNPSGIVTEMFFSLGLQRVVGICDAPQIIKLALGKFFSVPCEEIVLDYFGLNHLGWVRRAFLRGEDVIPKVLSLLQAFPQALDFLKVSSAWLSRTSLLPNPYLFYYLSPEKALKEQEREKETRGERVKAWNQWLFSALEEGKEDPEQVYKKYLKLRESQYGEASALLQMEEGAGYSGVAMEVIGLLEGVGKGAPVVNLKNGSAIEGMDPEDVVEVSAEFVGGRLLPRPVGKIPEECLSLMKAVKAYEKKLIEGLKEGSLEKVGEAFALHPLIGECGPELVSALGVRSCNATF
ncbi:MAG: hypothetical protein QMD88_03670 [Coprothermobacterota bacterium]|nr:hypothetical protein [Coprothermobacterota bacterium]